MGELLCDFLAPFSTNTRAALELLRRSGGDDFARKADVKFPCSHISSTASICRGGLINFNQSVGMRQYLTSLRRFLSYWCSEAYIKTF